MFSLPILQFKGSASEEEIVFEEDAWILLFSCKSPSEDLLSLNEVTATPPKKSASRVVINK